MRQEYPDPEQFMQKRMEGAAKEYVDGLAKRGLRDNPKVQRAFFDKTMKQVEAEYKSEVEATLSHNIGGVIREQKQRDRQIRREGARAALVFCPLAILMFGAVAWLNFSQHDVAMAALYGTGALIFLAILIGAIARLRK